MGLLRLLIEVELEEAVYPLMSTMMVIGVGDFFVIIFARK